MKEIHDYQQDIASIRSAMERSVKFISLSGLSGVLAGFYALIGSGFVYYMLYYPYAPYGIEFSFTDERSTVLKIFLVASVVLVLSLATGYFLSLRKARKLAQSVWSKASQQLLVGLLIPLVTGGLFILVVMIHGYFTLIAPACLIFYGLALIQASPYTFSEVRYLGFSQIALGLIATTLPGYGLLFWATGFGLLHIIYGSVMHFRYDS